MTSYNNIIFDSDAEQVLRAAYHENFGKYINRTKEEEDRHVNGTLDHTIRHMQREVDKTCHQEVIDFIPKWAAISLGSYIALIGRIGFANPNIIWGIGVVSLIAHNTAKVTVKFMSERDERIATSSCCINDVYLLCTYQLRKGANGCYAYGIKYELIQWAGRNIYGRRVSVIAQIDESTYNFLKSQPAYRYILGISSDKCTCTGYYWDTDTEQMIPTLIINNRQLGL